MLIGEPGVGKTATSRVGRGVIAANQVPELPEEQADLHALDLAALVAGSKYRGEFEEPPEEGDEGDHQRGDIILFIDELHNLVGAGRSEGAIDAASILKLALARGELQTIGATTLDEYRKYLERDAALERRFQQVRVEEPTIDELVVILRGLRDRYEAHHRVKITDQALHASAVLADRYIHDRHLPDKAIDLTDEAGSRVRIRTMSAPPRYRELEEEIETVRADKEAAIEAQEFEKAASPATRKRKLSQKKKELGGCWRNEADEEQPEIGEDEIADIVSMRDGDPGLQAHRGRVAEARPHGGGAPQARDRPGGGNRGRLEGDPPCPRGNQGPEAPRPARSSSSAPRAWGRPSLRGRSPRVPVRDEDAMIQVGHVGVHGEALRVPASSSARLRATSATTRAASSPRPSAASRTRCCSSTRSRRRTRTCSTSSSRSSRTGS